MLEGARDAFAEHGLGATYSQIASAADVAVGTVHRRFPDKAELIDAVFEELVDEVVAAAAQAEQADDPWDGIVMFLQRSLELQTANRGFKQHMFSHDEHALRARERITPPVERLFARAHRAGALAPGLDPTDLLLLSFAISEASDFVHRNHPELWRRQMHYLLEGMRNRPSPAPAPAPPALTQDELVEAMTTRPGAVRQDP